MGGKEANQSEFSSVLFDSLFGLVIFFSLDYFLEIHDILHLAFYTFSIVIVMHWWMLFKSADDAFNEEVTQSTVDLFIGLIYIICIAIFLLFLRAADYQMCLLSIIGLFATDMSWGFAWLYLGRWGTKKADKIRRMECRLHRGLKMDYLMIAIYSALFLSFDYISRQLFGAVFVAAYVLFVLLTFRLSIIKIKFF